MHTVANLTVTFATAGDQTINIETKLAAFLTTQCPIHNLKYSPHATGYNLEGDWNSIISVLKACQDSFGGLATAGNESDPGMKLSIVMGTRIDKHSTMENKLEAVETHLQKMQSSQ
ncbi:hypothetical protein BCR33DRAFT_719339 [Rhizoclosmatium globosum]|uniref:Thiamine-binding protein domain-containing protein n=1 Tax=Rhizoclosmatium globosum TaxID=329046 RepID=A0A1Y2C1C7_9FUNG|nr:hypothetical protein BCR33DRAFT_725132 [Rhizoclosmatium globosum]ORY40830.1 hypothetical protein BCR33DRAFT_719339 [Rhizoclosmatium globosum]|eukprot:ORY28429.1 hypothetical protein BCR33DRAFT_725132 [Rhizoclosmatium globosum]